MLLTETKLAVTKVEGEGKRGKEEGSEGGRVVVEESQGGGRKRARGAIVLKCTAHA